MIELGNERFLKLFGQKKPDDWNGKVFLPVVHVKSGGLMYDSAIKGAIIAYDNKADGVLLIDMSGGRHDMLTTAAVRVMEYFQAKGIDFPVGVNYLDLSCEPRAAVYEAALSDIPILWTDCPDGKEAVEYARKDCHWEGLYMGAFAFKYDKPVPYKKLPRVAQESTWMDVSVTSGPATGETIDPEKVKIAAQAIPGQPLGIASGVSAGNIRKVVAFAQVYIVSTSICINDMLDPQRTRILADYIHGWNP